MKLWVCPGCGREREYIVELIMKICPVCQTQMEVKNRGYNGKFFK